MRHSGQNCLSNNEMFASSSPVYMAGVMVAVLNCQGSRRVLRFTGMSPHVICVQPERLGRARGGPNFNNVDSGRTGVMHNESN
jgi:hypothetical protein